MLRVKILVCTFILFLLTPIQVVESHHTPRTAVIEKIMPAVVDVLSERFGSIAPSSSGRKGFVPSNPGKPENQSQVANGSGFVISSDGYIVTNAHVIENIKDNQGRAWVTFENGNIRTADLVNADFESDIALLKIVPEIPGETFPFVEWGTVPEVGQRTIAIGSPMHLIFTASFGNVSAINRFSPEHYAAVPFVQTDASINPGNSGGPLFDSHGNVIGINTMIVSTNAGNGGSIGLGFAIQVNYAKQTVERLKTGKPIQRALVGVMFRNATKEEHPYIKNNIGAYVTQVLPKSPADGKLMVNDIIMQIDGEDIKVKMLSNVIAMKNPNTDVILTIIRQKKIMQVTLKLGMK